MFNKFNFLIENFTANETNRIELNGIFLNKNFSVATDAFIMIEVSTPKDNIDDFPLIPGKPKPKTNFEPFILPKEKIKEITKLFFKENKEISILNNAIILEQTDEKIEIATTDLESMSSVVSKTIQGEYPHYKEILNQQESQPSLEFLINPHYLKKIIDFYCKFLDKKDELKICIPKDTEQTIRFYGKREQENKEQEAKALLMPIRNIKK